MNFLDQLSRNEGFQLVRFYVLFSIMHHIDGCKLMLNLIEKFDLHAVKLAAVSAVLQHKCTGCRVLTISNSEKPLSTLQTRSPAYFATF